MKSLQSILTRVTIQQDPFVPGPREFQRVNWRHTDLWPGRWIKPSFEFMPPAVIAYRLSLRLSAPLATRIHVSADEHYVLYLNGEAVGQGPERGDSISWYYESYDLNLPAGDHMLVAVVCSLGPSAPVSWMSVQHGFLLVPEASPKLLATGEAGWECKRVEGIHVSNKVWFVDGREEVRGAEYPWGINSGVGDDWKPVQAGEFPLPANHAETAQGRHALVPAQLPPQYEREVHGLKVRHVKGEEEKAWQTVLDKLSFLALPEGTEHEVLIDCEDYVCAYPKLTVSGGTGSRISLGWAESLFETPADDCRDKGNRDEVDGKFWQGPDDTFLPDGGQHREFSTLWWRAGRYLRLQIKVGKEPLSVERFSLTETRYPLEDRSRFKSNHAELHSVWPIMLRGLQMCSHETYMDCPYYEQLQYVGDTRLEALVTLALTGDHRLPRKAIKTYYHSLLPNGLTQSRYPSREMQVIPPFSLWWVCMVQDYAWWCDDPETVKSVLPGVRTVMHAGEAHLNEDGIIGHLPGWNFIDWVQDDHWKVGVPDDTGSGTAAPLQWQWILALKAAIDLEAHFGSTHIRSHYSELLSRALQGVEQFWDASKSLYANDLSISHWSEHANCLALSSGLLSDERQQVLADSLFSNDALPRASIYFSHYYLEAARMTKRPEAFFKRMEEWYDLKGQGFKTPRETPEPSRSDCHAWGSHPMFHAFATLLGIRPTSPGFASVSIDPLQGLDQDLSCEMPHPGGILKVTIRNGEIIHEAPAGVKVTVDEQGVSAGG